MWIISIDFVLIMWYNKYIRKEIVMNIEPMDYNSRLDTSNYDDEIKFHIDNGDLNSQDLIDFLSEGRISIKQFINYIEYGGLDNE